MKTDNSDRRDSTIHVRVNAKEHARIKRWADQQGMSMASYFRMAALSLAYENERRLATEIRSDSVD